jgi:hypothetical protein
MWGSREVPIWKRSQDCTQNDAPTRVTTRQNVCRSTNSLCASTGTPLQRGRAYAAVEILHTLYAVSDLVLLLSISRVYIYSW